MINHGPKNLIIAIAGNKEDLVEKEQVDMIEAKNFAESIGAIYKKTSAKTRYGIEQLFREIASRVYEGRVISTRERRGTVKVTSAMSVQPGTGREKKKCC